MYVYQDLLAACVTKHVFLDIGASTARVDVLYHVLVAASLRLESVTVPQELV